MNLPKVKNAASQQVPYRIGGHDAAILRRGRQPPDMLCGNWESVEGKPDVLIYKEGEAYKVTVFRQRGLCAGEAAAGTSDRRITTTKIQSNMRTRITMIICLCLLFAGRASAQWVVSDPGNLAQGIINAGGQRERAVDERQGAHGYHRPVLHRHAPVPDSGAVLHQQEHRRVLPACQEAERH